jgi:predicted nucleic acid-binding protein
VADTSVWIDYVRGVVAPHTNLLDYELGHTRVVTGDLIIAEFLQGFRNESEYRIAKDLMDKLAYRDFVGKENAVKASDNFRLLRKNGITIRKTIDVLIATFCIENNFPLLHNDRDFDPMERLLGLRVLR